MFKFKISNPLIFTSLVLLLIESVSFLAYFLPFLQIYLLLFVFVIVFLVSLLSLENGILIMISELIIGSKGHLLSANIFGVSLSLRLAIFLALITASLFYIYRNGLKKIYHERLWFYKFWPYILLLVFFIVLAAINGYFFNNNLNYLFNDLNAWFFIALLLPLSLVYLPNSTDKQKSRLLSISTIALIFLSLKTLFFLFVFSHNLAFMPDLYLWIRRSGVGEITAMGGGYNRIFIQSQVYIAIAIFFVMFKAIKEKTAFYLDTRYLSLLIIFLSVIILSMSRSFWLATALSGFIGAIFVFRNNWGSYLKAFAYMSIALILALSIIYLIVKFPYPKNQDVSLSALSERLVVNSDEAATASRWALLPALWQRVIEKPIIGNGFGATVSYYSKDPRVLENNPNGLYTSYAFEWAYLDTALKLGLFGFLAYIILLIKILYNLWRNSLKTDNYLLSALAVGLLFLMIVNIFTPYLNHPLGLSFLLLSSCFVKKNPI